MSSLGKHARSASSAVNLEALAHGAWAEVCAIETPGGVFEQVTFQDEGSI